jgi:hypothetical protein
MDARVVVPQQAQSNPNTRQGTPEQQAQPARPEAGARTSPLNPEELRAQIQSAIEAAQQAQANARAARAERGANRVRIEGLPVIAGDGQAQIVVPPRGAPDMIPPQAVDISIAFFVMLAVIVIGWPLARAFGRRLERGAQSAAVPAAMQEQLQRIEQAVDAMSIEVERISESQRFLAKLQSGASAEPEAVDAGERR